MSFCADKTIDRSGSLNFVASIPWKKDFPSIAEEFVPCCDFRPEQEASMAEEMRAAMAIFMSTDA